MQGSALPLPLAGALIEIAPVALPEGDVAAAQALGVSDRSFPLDEEAAQVAVFVGVGVGLGPALGAEPGRDQFFDLAFLGVDVPDLAGAVGGGQHFLQLPPEPLNVLFPPGEVSQRVVEMEIQQIPLAYDFLERQLVLDRGPAGVHPGEGIRGGFELFGADARSGPGGKTQAKEQQKGGERLSHERVRELRMPVTSIRIKTVSELSAMALASARKSLESGVR